MLLAALSLVAPPLLGEDTAASVVLYYARPQRPSLNLLPRTPRPC